MIESGLALIANASPTGLLLLFWYFFVLELPRYALSTLTVALHALKRDHDAPLDPSVPVSVLVAGMNDAEGLQRTVLSLREQTHPNLQVVVVEDGGGTAMSRLAQDLQQSGLIHRYLATGTRGGKAAALNLGLRACQHEYLVVMDVDSSLDCDAIDRIGRRLQANPAVGAVAGNLAVRNADRSVWTAFQALEYLSAISMGRQFLALFDLLTIVSGAFGLFRRSAIEQAGGWDVGPGDDSNLTLKLRRAGWAIDFAPQAWCLTDAPVTLGALRRQRLRWSRSLIRNRWRKFSGVFNPRMARFRWRDLVATVNQLFFNVFLTFSYFAYLIHLLLRFGTDAIVFIVAIHILILLVHAGSFFLTWGVVGRPGTLGLVVFVPGWTLYQGILMRFIRLEAYLGELILRRSYTDPFYPARVRAAQERF